ncbi:hypothetical protein GCK72_011045 [Caenorhabditis remanei]|uniref:Uncharacterized protein n=1 Tax=Caenorhabditis remanei TaxID=31234 RepID=A0A6A5H8R9_CAERE|nr:hypothetical protein GCK72_011045 [Caenorhabditis remanei]KAF1762782.1 hypothetical protein GCK72_011045 [Caenorhabditis remanei]
MDEAVEVDDSEDVRFLLKKWIEKCRVGNEEGAERVGEQKKWRIAKRKMRKCWCTPFTPDYRKFIERQNRANGITDPHIEPMTYPPVTTTMAVETTESLITTSTAGSNTKTIIVTCCIIGVVILLCVGIALFYFRRKKTSAGTKDINSVESNSKTNKKNKKDAQFARY